MTDALTFEAFSSEYIEYLIAARLRQLPEAAPLMLMRRQDVLELELPPADLSAYPDLCVDPQSSIESAKTRNQDHEIDEGNSNGDD